MAYSKIIKEYIKEQKTRPDWNRKKIDGICGSLQYDKLSDGTYIIYNYKENKVIAYGLDNCIVSKPKAGWDNPSLKHTIVIVWKNDKINFLAPWIDKNKLILKMWADGHSPQCSTGNKFTLYFGDNTYKLNLDISPKLIKGSYNMWTIGNVDY